MADVNIFVVNKEGIMDGAIWVWGVIIVGTLITEFVTDELISIWFSAGAVVGLVLAICNAPIWVQIVVFVAVSAILLISTRKLVKKFTKKPTEKTNADSLVGKRTKLLTAITEDSKGSVKFDGVVWTAITKGDESIEAGKRVEVTAMQGNKLVVKEVKEEK